MKHLHLRRALIVAGVATTMVLANAGAAFAVSSIGTAITADTTIAAGTTITAGTGLRATTGGLIVTAGGVTITAGGLDMNAAGAITNLGVTGASLTRAGAHALTLTTTAATNVILPTTGTLATLAGAEALTNKTLTAPTINGGTATALTGLAIRDTSAAFDVTLAAVSSAALTAGKTLTLDMVNADKTVKLGGNLTLANALTTAGNFALTLNTTAGTDIILPTTGTLATLAGAEALTNKTIVAGSNTITGITNGMLAGGAYAGITSVGTLTGLAVSGPTTLSGTGAAELLVTGAPAASATSSLVQLDAVALVGGSANGTYIGANPAAFTGNFIELQLAGVSKFKISSAGAVTATSFVGPLTGAVTGNADTATTAATVTGAAQAAITSVGTLTGLAVNGGLTIGPATSHIISSQTTAPTNAGGGSCTGAAVTAGSTDIKGNVTTTSCTADQTITVTFNAAYPSAPTCVVSPANAAAAVTASAGAVTFAAATTDVLTITTPHVGTTAGSWNYICIQ